MILYEGYSRHTCILVGIYTCIALVRADSHFVFQAQLLIATKDCSSAQFPSEACLFEILRLPHYRPSSPYCNRYLWIILDLARKEISIVL